MKKVTKLLSTTVMALLLLATPAIAKDHGKGKGHSHGEGHGRWEEDRRDDDHGRGEWRGHREDDDVNIIIYSEHNRDRLRHYVAEDYHHRCPPGLAKKHNGCMPPGHVRKYRVGYVLPRTVVYEPVPTYWLEELEPVPYGYRYVRVDRDVLLISEASHKVIDAITLLSAVGN